MAALWITNTRSPSPEGSASAEAPRSALNAVPEPSTPPTIAPIEQRGTILLDPGHNGGNSTHPAAIGRQVPDGRGHTKACNSTGTATNNGYPEHAFNWDVAQRISGMLKADGYHVEMTRKDDSGVGPCVDERAGMANRIHAAALVSIHADGSTLYGAHGFHISYSNPPLNPAQEDPSRRLASAVHDGMIAGGLQDSTYLGHLGIYPRSDLAGLNLAEVPAILIECGNMRDAQDAKLLTSVEGRNRYARAIANGIEAWNSR